MRVTRSWLVACTAREGKGALQARLWNAIEGNRAAIQSGHQGFEGTDGFVQM